MEKKQSIKLSIFYIGIAHLLGIIFFLVPTFFLGWFIGYIAGIPAIIIALNFTSYIKKSLEKHNFKFTFPIIELIITLMISFIYSIYFTTFYKVILIDYQADMFHDNLIGAYTLYIGSSIYVLLVSITTIYRLRK